MKLIFYLAKFLDDKTDMCSTKNLGKRKNSDF